jgi:DNA-directed RNA polymerase specialized sigma24 family protein
MTDPNIETPGEVPAKDAAIAETPSVECITDPAGPPAAEADAQPDAQPPDAQPEEAQAPQQKAERERRDVRPVLERLFQLHPQLFGARFLPLKLGVFEDLMARHPGEFTKEDLKAALGTHARSTRYLESVASGAQRHDLDGKPVEPVAPEHVHHAIMEVFRRRKGRGKDDLKPWLHTRFVRALEASGLSREDYVERVRATDDVSLAAIDEAWHDIAGRNAKREALRRAYEASGKSVQEFADMYGMKLGEVKRLLG